MATDIVHDTQPSSQKVFDPILTWYEIESHITAPYSDHDLWVQQRDSLLTAAISGIPKEEQDEAWSRIYSTERARWGLNQIQKLNAQHNPGFEISELADIRSTTEVIAAFTDSRPVMMERMHQGQRPQENSFVPTDPIDALCLSSAIPAVALTEHLFLGRTAVDLGGGTGSFAIPLAMAGFDITSIEQNGELHDEAVRIEKTVRERGAKISGNIRFLHDTFYADPGKNSETVNDVLRTADLMVSYPWPQNKLEPLEIYRAFAKPTALLVTYHSGLDMLNYTQHELDAYGMQSVGTALRLPSTGARGFILQRKP